MNLRVKAYLLTFFGYIFFHSLMTAYSFAAPFFQQTYKLSNTYIGAVDGTLYFSKGVGFLLRYRIIKQSSIMKHFFISSTIFVSAYFLFPFLSLANFLNIENVKPIFFILITVYGFFLYNNWTVSLSIINNYYTTEKDGSKLGFWSAAGDFGSIVGFLFPSLLIIQLQWSWQISLIVLSVISFLFNWAIYYFLPQEHGENSNQLQKDEQDRVIWSEFKHYFWQFFKKPNNLLFTIIICCYKALTYTFLLWLPTYIDSKGQQGFSAFLSIIFNISTIVGSYCLGKVYEVKTQKLANQTLVQYVFVITGIVVMLGLIVMIKINFSVFAFAFLIALQGFAIGGFYNMLVCHQIIREVEENEKDLNFYTVVTGGVSNIFVGVSMFVTGAYMNANEGQGAANTAYDNIFKLALAVSIIGIGLLFLRVIQKRSSANKNTVEQLEEEKPEQKLQLPNQDLIQQK